MKKIMMVLSVCLALAATTFSFGSMVPLSATRGPAEFLGGRNEIVKTTSMDQPASVALETASAETIREHADDDEGEEAEKKDGEDEEKGPQGPDRLWDAGKLG